MNNVPIMNIDDLGLPQCLNIEYLDTLFYFKISDILNPLTLEVVNHRYLILCIF